MAMFTEPTAPRARFAKQVHAEAHAIVALRSAASRVLRATSVGEVLDELRRMIAARVQRLGLPPDVMSDLLEPADDERALDYPVDPERIAFGAIPADEQLAMGERVMRLSPLGTYFGTVSGFGSKSTAVYVRWDDGGNRGAVPRVELLRVACNLSRALDAVAGPSLAACCTRCGEVLTNGHCVLCAGRSKQAAA